MRDIGKFTFYEADGHTFAAMPDRSIAPPIKNATEFQFILPRIEKRNLKNGIPVYALNAGEENVVQIEWVFKAGNSYEEKSMVAATTNFMLRNGTVHKTAHEINEHFDYYGSHLNRNSFSETSNITLHGLVKYLPELLPVVRELITESVFPEEELEIFIQNSRQKLEVNLLKNDYVANREMDVLLYGPHHPYGKYTTREALDELSRADLLAFYKQHYLQGELAIFIAGRLPENWLEMLELHFGDLDLTPATFQKMPPAIYEARAQTGQRIDQLNDPNGVQAAIRIMRNFPNRNHDDFAAVQVLNALYGGFFGSRLMSNIREEKGYTYGIYSYLANYVEQSAWIVSTEAGRQVADATVQEVYAEMEALRKEPVDEEELQLVRNYLLGSVLGSLDGPFQVMNRWKGYILHGDEEASYFYHAVDTIKNVTAEELQRLANKYLHPEAFYELVVI